MQNVLGSVRRGDMEFSVDVDLGEGQSGNEFPHSKACQAHTASCSHWIQLTMSFSAFRQRAGIAGSMGTYYVRGGPFSEHCYPRGHLLDYRIVAQRQYGFACDRCAEALSLES